MAIQYKRILLKVSGEALSGPKGTGFDEETIASICAGIKAAHDLGAQIGIVVGGGNFWRGRSSGKMERTLADKIGMLATVMNALAVSDKLEQLGVPASRYELHCQSHADLLQIVQPGTADAVMFNFGWLPGADHAVFSTAQSSIPALQAALEAVRPGGVVSAILYSGQVIGTDEKQTVLEYLRALPLKNFTVLVCDFANWAETAPLPCIILKK